MGDCYLDDCQKKEWSRLRKLRLQQVRDLSKDVAEEVRKRTKEKQIKKKEVLKAQKERIFEEYKKMKCDELEQKYYEAMEKMGLAHAAANNEPDAENVLKERQNRNDRMAAVRGKAAEQKQLSLVQEAREKENAPIRRKELTRCVEDIRSGLVVQCRDWTVINEANRQRHVLLDIPVPSADDFQPRVQAKPVPVVRSVVLTPSPKRAVLKSPKSPRTPRSAKPYPLSPGNKTPPKRPPVVPKLTGFLSSNRSAMEKSPERPLFEFYNRCGQTYRMEPPKATKELIPSSDDEELSLLLKKYTSLRPIERTPPKIERLKLTGHTPPTRENDYSTREPIKRKSSESNKKSSRNETKKLFKAIDKALAEGRKLQEEVSKNSASIHESDSDSDDETVVQLIVNVNCGQKCGHENQGQESATIAEKSDEKSAQIVEKINVATEIGQSLDESEKRKPKKRVKKLKHVPVRSSTVEDLTKDESDVDVIGNFSSIDDASQREVVDHSPAWSSTVYLNSPEKKLPEEKSFRVNPFLDYYIRKLLDMAPDPCESSACTDCQCSSSNSLSQAKTVDNSQTVDLEEESDRRLKKISELKQILQQIRKEKEILELSSTTVSPGSSGNRVAHETSDMSSSDSKPNTIRETLSAKPIAPVPSELPRQLSTITEVDSRLQISDPPDIMEELLRRGIIQKPFTWTDGKSLSDVDEKGKSNESASTIGSYHPHLTHIDDDWVAIDPTIGGSRFETISSSESSIAFSDI